MLRLGPTRSAMPRIPEHTRDSLPDEARQAVEQIAGSVGRLSHMLGELAHSQAVFDIYLGKTKALKDHATFDAKTREAIALAMANENGCEYCEASHTRSGRRAGWTEDDLAEAFAHIMGNIFNNYFNRYARTEFDFPPAPPLPD
jgi:AhpD family alkylhydroperoxidase